MSLVTTRLGEVRGDAAGGGGLFEEGSRVGGVPRGDPLATDGAGNSMCNDVSLMRMRADRGLPVQRVHGSRAKHRRPA
jgi:hypothetical protein